MKVIALLILCVSVHALDMTSLTAQIASDEGCRLQTYKDTLGYATIGFGHRCSPNQSPIRLDTAKSLLAHDIQKAIKEAKSIVGDNAPDEVLEIIVQMCFQLGPKGVLGFHHMLKDIANEDYIAAARHMEHSNWCKQTPKRALRLSQKMRNIDD